jgi:radical SAM-linked protein
MENPASAPVQGPQSLQTFARMLTAEPPEPELFEQAVGALERDRWLEHGWLLLRQARLEPALWAPLLARMKAVLERSRRRRMSLWQSDPDRVTLRLRFALRAPACAQPALALLARTLMEAGLPVAAGLEKAPRPAIRLGHPLPALVEGCSEWADVVLLEAPPIPLADLPALVNSHAPQGLAVLQCLQVPNYASPVAELCRAAHWRWTCPEPELAQVRERMRAFSASERFEIQKAGKIGGQKGVKRVDIRPLLEDCRWDGADLLFRTRVAPGEAANPRKLLAAILGPGLEIQGLARTELELGEDPRLLQAEKFQPKLHNMFEDAVLLGAEGNIRIVDEDDDEPTVLS